MVNGAEPSSHWALPQGLIPLLILNENQAHPMYVEGPLYPLPLISSKAVSGKEEASHHLLHTCCVSAASHVPPCGFHSVPHCVHKDTAHEDSETHWGLQR